MKSLNAADVTAILGSWVGAAGISYISQDPGVAFIALCACYYLCKWVILKKES